MFVFSLRCVVCFTSGPWDSSFKQISKCWLSLPPHPSSVRRQDMSPSSFVFLPLCPVRGMWKGVCLTPAHTGLALWGCWTHTGSVSLPRPSGVSLEATGSVEQSSADSSLCQWEHCFQVQVLLTPPDKTHPAQDPPLGSHLELNCSERPCLQRVI